MSQYDDNDVNSDGEIEAHELHTLLSILKAQGIDTNVFLRELILLSSMHYLWEKTIPPPPSTMTMTMAMMMSTPILYKLTDCC